MVEETPAEARLAELEERWREDPTPHLALQLAEEYRQREEPLLAEEVLEEEIRLRPGHLSAQVALGKSRLRLGRTAEALEAFERVVAEDSTHLLANRLLVDAYLELGQDGKARDRLDLYSLLNEGDPEIALLEARLRERGWGTESEEQEGSAEDDTEPLELAPPEAEELEEPWPVLESLQVPSEPPPPTVRPEPFAGVWEGVGDDPYWSLLEAEGLFVRLLPGVDEEADLQLDQPEATATLGGLYLEQGHLAEAERVFRRVLEEDPEGSEARQGLERLSRLRGGPLSAQELLAGIPGLEEMAPRRRKALLLRRYLERLRGGNGKGAA